MSINRKLIRDKIMSLGGIVAFSERYKIRQASLSNFLNGKSGILFDSFEKIISGVELEICDKRPDKLIEVENVYIDGECYGKGMDYEGEQIASCLGCQGSAHQFLLFEKDNGDYWLMSV